MGALLLSGCSVLVGGGGDSPIRCEAVDPDPCHDTLSTEFEQWRCIDGFCQRAMPMEESCNGEDDDGDGVIDEELDEDGDGFTWCPTGAPPVDCDDTNPNVHPSGDGLPVPELCDGLDNDCDTMTPDGASECSATQDCDALGAGCVDINCSTRPTLCTADQFCNEDAIPPACELSDTTCLNPARPCSSGMVCNPATAACVTPATNGTFCDYDAECVSHLCVPIPALRVLAAHVGERNGVCSRSCCTDVECGSGEVCWASGSGARACVLRSLLDMGTYGVPSSTLCAASRDCAEECVIDVDNAYEVPERLGLSCSAALVDRTACFFGECLIGYCLDDDSCGYRTCFENANCPTGLCVGGRCRETCGTTEDCPSASGLGAPACLFGTARSGGRDDYIPLCSYSSTGTGTRGGVCGSDGDCRDRTCVDASGDPLPEPGTPTFCADVCCADRNCGAGEQCRPIFVHGHWENHCLEEPSFGAVGTPP